MLTNRYNYWEIKLIVTYRGNYYEANNMLSS
jgi:hypothetical protein